jgi:hypothetical protein
MKFRDDILFYVLVLLVIACVGYSYFRFVVTQDYVVEYEGVCDPATHECFKGCPDDACTDPYYYDTVRRSAVDLFAQCGKDITNCSAANTCSPQNDRSCSITYCNPQAGDVCKTTVEGVSTTTSNINL